MQGLHLPPPLLTSCTELELVREESCSQPHHCEYLYAHSQRRGVCGGRESERGERGGGGNTVGFGHNWKTTKRAQHAPSGRHIDGCRSQHFTYSPPPPRRRRPPCDRIQARMELPAAGEHVFAVEGIEKKRIRKVTERERERERGGGRVCKKRALDA